MSVTRRLLLLASCSSLFLFGCSPYTVRQFDGPPLVLPTSFQSATSVSTERSQSRLWWMEFNDPELNRLMQVAFSENPSLRAAWARLRQARAQATIVGSEQYPELTLRGSGTRTRSDVKSLPTSQQFIPAGTRYESDFIVGAGLSYEIDLWKRISSQVESEEWLVSATQADLENTALLLAGSIAESWFSVQSQKALLNLLKEQVKASETFLELTELRFTVGRSSALDVYQQRQQLAATRSAVPEAMRAFELAKNQLSTLVGRVPGDMLEVEPDGSFNRLPEFPTIVTPLDLLELRPDLRAAQYRLQASEYDVAAAVAERFPRLSIGLDYDFRTDDLSNLFERETGSLAGNLLLPLIDGGRRRARVDQQTARVEELLSQFSEVYLAALQDVENAIVTERYQKELLHRLELQAEYSKSTLRESRSRYTSGLTDYLDVIISVQALQDIERRLINERSSLLIARARLYQAMGGPWTSLLMNDEITVVRARRIESGIDSGHADHTPIT